MTDAKEWQVGDELIWYYKPTLQPSVTHIEKICEDGTIIPTDHCVGRPRSQFKNITALERELAEHKKREEELLSPMRRIFVDEQGNVKTEAINPRDIYTPHLPMKKTKDVNADKIWNDFRDNYSRNSTPRKKDEKEGDFDIYGVEMD